MNEKTIVNKYLNESKKKTLKEVASYVESEGLGYSIQSGLSWKDIEDKKLASLWKKADDIMSDIEDILEWDDIKF